MFKRIGVAFFAFFALLLIVGCGKTKKKYDNKNHKYSEVISTDGISYVEFRTNNDYYFVVNFEYNADDYITITDEEKNRFIESIDSDNLQFKYFGAGLDQYKGMFTNTFIIHYENESIIYLDEHHIEKINEIGESIYFEIVDAYKCKIWKNLFD